jgi:hypothetical protein
MKRRRNGIEVLHEVRADAQKEAAMIGSSRVAWRQSGKGADPALVVLVVLTVAAWLLAVVLGGVAGMFESGPSQPPLPILAALAVPLGIFGLGYALSPRFRDFVLSLDLRMLTAAQSWRDAASTRIPQATRFSEFGAFDSLSRFMVELRRASGRPDQFQSAVSASLEQLRLLEMQGEAGALHYVYGE